MPETPATIPPPDVLIQPARVLRNVRLCREHYRLTCRVPDFPLAAPGQFVHLSPESGLCDDYRPFNWDEATTASHDTWVRTYSAPMLRRAFSIAGLRRADAGIDIDVIYRVVGAATHWMQSLARGDSLSLMGPLGNRFPIHDRPRAWLVAGGVGLPPMLWLAEALGNAGMQTTAFCGAQTGDLLALRLEPAVPPSSDARAATSCVTDFAAYGADAVISTDDGTLGFHGHIGAATAAYHAAAQPPPDDLVVYTCGPERMMEFVARFCIERNITCYACMERAMACGTGLCQSCVVPMRDPADVQGWRYRLCCTEGPVFDVRDIIWEPKDLP